MKEAPKQEPKKIKIVVKPSGPVIKKVNIKEELVKDAPVKPPKKKSILRRIGEIVSNDIHNLPTRIWGEKQKQKKVNMPESNESWKDWEGEL